MIKPANAAAKNPAIHVISASDRKAIEALFGARGACAGCWCMHWRLERGGQLWRDMQGDPNRREFFKLLDKDRIRAVIALWDGEPVGWCSFGPRSDFPRLERSRVFHRADAAHETWTIVCFFIKAGWRGKGIATSLLLAATKEALRLGAREIEGLPALHPKGKQLAAVFAWTGVAEMFEAAGYHPAESTTGRLLYVKTR